MDFNITLFKSFLKALESRCNELLTFKDYFFNMRSTKTSSDSSFCILRHDVDRLPGNARQIAQLEAEFGIRGTFYFRIAPEVYNKRIIAEIAELGHEVGYHYEDIDLIVRRQKSIGSWLGAEVGCQKSEVIGQRSEVRSQKSVLWKEPLTSNNQQLTDLIDLAMESFVKNLERIRNIVDVKTICMHGSPMSPYDNRLLWTKYDYRDYGIIGEPYFDVDFSQVAYYTDTGRRWDGESVSVRDKVDSKKYVVGSGVEQSSEVGGRRPEVGGQRSEVRGQRSEIRGQRSANDNRLPAPDPRNPIPGFPKFRSTHEMIKAIEDGRFPQKAMLTIHPQRWHDRPLPWVRELVWQRCKNVVKFILVRSRK